jgi:hypothetical protein
MELIAGRYAGNISGDIPEERLRSVAIISIDIESMTGKRSG